MLMAAGLNNQDPHLGVEVKPHRPPQDQYHFEMKGPGIIAGMVVSIAFMILITGTRLGIRYLRPKLKWGWDDWLITPGVVGDVVNLANGLELTKYSSVDFRSDLTSTPDRDGSVRRSRETHR